MGLSALLSQDLKLVSVLKAVAVWSYAEVSLLRTPCLWLAAHCREDFPAVNSVLNLHCRADRNSVCCGSDGSYVVEYQAMWVFSWRKTQGSDHLPSFPHSHRFLEQSLGLPIRRDHILFVPSKTGRRLLWQAVSWM